MTVSLLPLSVRRRALLGMAACATAAVMLPVSLSQAQEPGLKLAGAGENFARYTLGDITIVALRDGYVDMPPSRLRQESEQAFEKLPAQVALVDGQLRLSVNAFLVIDGKRHILIDAGAGNAWHPTMGLLPRALAEAGIDAGQIDTVAFTHTHLDHVAGLVADDGSDALPNAREIWVPIQEIPHFKGSARLARYHDRVQGFEDGYALTPNIVSVHAPGHEVGHSGFLVTTTAGKLLIWGDIVHVPSIQFDHPALTWEFDGNQAEARSTRMRMLARAAAPDTYVAGSHLDFPGVGKVLKAGGSFRFLPFQR